MIIAYILLILLAFAHAYVMTLVEEGSSLYGKYFELFVAISAIGVAFYFSFGLATGALVFVLKLGLFYGLLFLTMKRFCKLKRRT